MTDTELRIKVAELTGEWSRICVADDVWPEAVEEGWVKKGCPLGHHDGHGHPEHLVVLPDYPNDLNAMHEAEDKLDNEKWDRYEYVLGVNVGQQESGWRKRFVRATARQRAEAFVKVMEGDKK
jgi:hypothetical protein